MEREREQQLIRRIREGDVEAFAGLVETHAAAVHALVRRIVPTKEEAEEVAQDVFLKAYRHLGCFDGRSSFRTWIYRIACNAALSAVRAKRPRRSLFDDRRVAALPAEEDAEERILTERQLEQLDRALERLEPAERALIHLHYLDEQPVAACARIFGLTETNVKVRLHRIRKKLRQWIDEPS